MSLQLAIVATRTDAGCEVRLLSGEEYRDARPTAPMVENNIPIRPGDLVAIDDHAGATQVVFRWSRARAERVDGACVVVRSSDGVDKAIPWMEGMQRPVAADAEVYVALGQVCDVAVDGRPSQPERMSATIFPHIRAMYQQIEVWNALDPKAVVAASYDAIAERYLEWIVTVRTEERARYTAVMLDALPAGAQVLDLGCGAGIPTTRILAGRFTVTGVDISPRQIELARANVPAAEFICADMTRLDQPPESYDGVISFGALIHVPREEHAALLRSIALWLRPGGLLIATMGTRAVRRDFADDFLGARMFWSGFDCETNVRMVEEAGLRIKSAQHETAIEFGKPVTFQMLVADKP